MPVDDDDEDMQPIQEMQHDRQVWPLYVAYLYKSNVFMERLLSKKGNH